MAAACGVLHAQPGPPRESAAAVGAVGRDVRRGLHGYDASAELVTDLVACRRVGPVEEGIDVGRPQQGRRVGDQRGGAELGEGRQVVRKGLVTVLAAEPSAALRTVPPPPSTASTPTITPNSRVVGRRQTSQDWGRMCTMH